LVRATGPTRFVVPGLATGGATAIGSGTALDVHGGDIYNATEPASLMLCLLGGALLAARRIHS
jgi:hypothetical protein